MKIIKDRAYHKFEFSKQYSIVWTNIYGSTLVTSATGSKLYDREIVEKQKFCEPEIVMCEDLIIKNETEQPSILPNRFDVEPDLILFHHTAYHHFLIDNLAAILFLKHKSKIPFSIKNICNYRNAVISNIKNFYQECFDYFNLGNYESTLVELSDKKDFISKYAIAVGTPSTPMDSFYEVIKILRDDVLNRNENNQTEPHRKIFVSRKTIEKENKSSRTVSDEHLLQEYFKKYGYETVYFEDMTFKQQIDTMISASHVVTYNGSSATNTLFMKRGTQIVEIMNSPMQQHDVFKIWSDWFERDHYIVRCLGANSSSDIIQAFENNDEISL